MIIEMKREMTCRSKLFHVDFNTRVKEIERLATVVHCKYIKLKNWGKLERLNKYHGNKQIGGIL
jgi:hypothetical protein